MKKNREGDIINYMCIVLDNKDQNGNLVRC
jgi:hypothetical protein